MRILGYLGLDDSNGAEHRRSWVLLVPVLVALVAAAALDLGFWRGLALCVVVPIVFGLGYGWFLTRRRT